MSVAPPVPRYRCRVPATSVNNGFFRRRCVGAPLGSGQLPLNVDFRRTGLRAGGGVSAGRDRETD